MENDILTLSILNDDGTVTEEEYEILFTFPHKDKDKEYVVFTDIESDEDEDYDDEEETELYKAIRDTSSGTPILYSIKDEEEEKMVDAMIDERLEFLKCFFDDEEE